MLIYYLIIFFSLILDQASKHIIRAVLEIREDIEVISGFFFITHVENTGAAWSILRGARWYLVSITIILIAVIFRLLYRQKNKLFRIAASMLIGGGLGNLIDRIISGRVTDFIDLHFWNYDFPVFNISDSIVFIATCLIIIYIIRLEGAGKNDPHG